MHKYCILFFLFLFTKTGFSQDVDYVVSFPNAVHHEASVQLTLKNVTGPLTFRMSRSSPGRYVTHEFGKNVYAVIATGKEGRMLPVKQIEGDVYQITSPDPEVKINYTVFGNWVDGTYLGIDETHAHMNMPATFMWAKGYENKEIRIRFNDLGKYNWKVATQLRPTADPAVFTAPDLQYFMDSPTELSNYHAYSFSDKNSDGTLQQIIVSTHSADDPATIQKFGKMVERMVAESKAVYGELPRFDFGQYVFLQDVNLENAGDGMEHRNSTVIVDRAEKMGDQPQDFLATFSHEFFHAWNVERIRPATLQPFNFEKANMSNELWFAEGFTQYYGELILKRAGFQTLKEYTGTLRGLLNGVLNAPGAGRFSPAEMSRRAVFTDAGVSVDQNNYPNTFTSYYIYGAMVALALDLRLRTEFNKTLDQYMRSVWRVHGKPEKPYTISDLQSVLASETNPDFAARFFKDHVEGVVKDDYKSLLAKAGLLVRLASPGKATLGSLRLVNTNGKMRVASATLVGTPAYTAGLDVGDLLLKVNKDELKDPADLNTLLSKYKPGDQVELLFSHRGLEKWATVTLMENNTLEVVPFEDAGLPLTPAMQQFRNNWLNTQIK